VSDCEVLVMFVTVHDEDPAKKVSERKNVVKSWSYWKGV